jgi:hypothetical protein
MAEAARCLDEAFRMTLEAHHLCKDGHRRAFSRYTKAKKKYDIMRGVEVVGNELG